ncbi:class I SAM-dependent RNA methyltransferase [Candidatus Gracilibacteria bacterium]|nr:class I SAM-dependent RNA methyltransferase [Candidatus Gracilibacteria bacterium]
MPNYLLTSSLGLESLVKEEVKRQDFRITEVQDKAVYFEGGIEAVPRMNLWSRFGNILYYIVDTQKNITDFDAYFDSIKNQDWKKCIPRDYEILVKATSIKSELSATSTMQALAKKAIVSGLVGDDMLYEDSHTGKIEIRILIENNTLRILINTSGDGLHKRGYREMTGEAPLKENIAAGLVIFSGWKFREPLYDMFCGSGTIAIEAAMIARNIAPGLKRHFAFENWQWIEQSVLEDEKKRAVEKQFSGEYKIYASDMRKEVIERAKRSAKFAGVDDSITFSVQDVASYLRRDISGYLVSNPPYGLRLEEDDIEGVHKTISELLVKNNDLYGGIITAYSEFENFSKTKYKKRKLYNGGELCYFYKKV